MYVCTYVCTYCMQQSHLFLVFRAMGLHHIRTYVHNIYTHTHMQVHTAMHTRALYVRTHAHTTVHPQDCALPPLLTPHRVPGSVRPEVPLLTSIFSCASFSDSVSSTTCFLVSPLARSSSMCSSRSLVYTLLSLEYFSSSALARASTAVWAPFCVCSSSICNTKSGARLADGTAHRACHVCTYVHHHTSGKGSAVRLGSIPTPDPYSNASLKASSKKILQSPLCVKL